MATSPSPPPATPGTKADPKPPASAGHVLSNGHRVYFELHGPEDGPGVVLLHHGLGSLRAWKSQVPALAEAGYRVLAYDRWGDGASDARPALDLPTFEADQADLAGRFDTARLEEDDLPGRA